MSRRTSRHRKKSKLRRERIARLRGEEPSLTNWRLFWNATTKRSLKAICASRAPISLTIDDEQGTREQDVAVMTDDEGIAERLSLGDAVEKLNENERAILLERYFKSKTQAETARLLGTTQVQISRNEKKIIEKLRYIMR